jgi:putative oxidoreductase
VLFSFAIVGIGIETIVCAHVGSHSLGPHYRVVPVIPWLPAIPSLAYAVGTIWVVCGLGLRFRRTAAVSSLTFGLLMLLFALVLAPKNPNLMDAGWRTNVLEPIAIGSLAWLTPGWAGIPGWLHRVSYYLLALVLIVFGIAHFQVLTFIASMVPGWIPWHRFWAVFFGIAFIAAGLSFIPGYLHRWAALGVGLMFALWVVTVHLPPLLGALHDPDKWSDVFIVAALWGGFWAIARNLPNTPQETAKGTSI